MRNSASCSFELRYSNRDKWKREDNIGAGTLILWIFASRIWCTAFETLAAWPLSSCLFNLFLCTPTKWTLAIRAKSRNLSSFESSIRPHYSFCSTTAVSPNSNRSLALSEQEKTTIARMITLWLLQTWSWNGTTFLPCHFDFLMSRNMTAGRENTTA